MWGFQTDLRRGFLRGFDVSILESTRGCFVRTENSGAGWAVFYDLLGPRIPVQTSAARASSSHVCPPSEPPTKPMWNQKTREPRWYKNHALWRTEGVNWIWGHWLWLDWVWLKLSLRGCTNISSVLRVLLWHRRGSLSGGLSGPSKRPRQCVRDLFRWFLCKLDSRMLQ